MAAYDYPLTRPFIPAGMDLWQPNNDVVERSVFGGGQQSSGQPGAHWMAALSFNEDISERRLELGGLLRKLNGKEHRLRLWDMRKFSTAGVQGSPAGTIATTGVQVKTLAAQFATTLVLKGCGAGATLLPGDMFSVNGQLLENCALATADGAGDMTVLVPSRLRASAAVNAAVTLVRPTALFVLADTFHLPRGPKFYEPFIVEFEEVFS
ncbi:MAG: hypothetical protein V4718_00520 [Pseudomonadota bacterium]